MAVPLDIDSWAPAVVTLLVHHEEVCINNSECSSI